MPFCPIADLIQKQLGSVVIKKPVFVPHSCGTENVIYYPDYKTWLCNDVEFNEYLQSLNSVEKHYLSVFDSPFRYEKPAGVDISAFTEKLIERTRLVVESETISGNKKIISPAISFFNFLYLNSARKFYSKTYHLYDVFSVDCCGSLNDIELGFVTKLLNEVLKYDKKEVWVYFATPCFDGNVEFHSYGERYTPPTHVVAIQNVDRIINTFKAITDNVKFFYYGLGQDEYSPEKLPTSLDFWSRGFKHDNYIPFWRWSHFIGLSDFEGRIKTDLMRKLLDTAEQLNAST